MITVMYQLHNTTGQDSVATVANEDQLIDLLDVLETSPRVMTYSIIDTDLGNLVCLDVGIYGCYPDNFPKFKVFEGTYSAH